MNLKTGLLTDLKSQPWFRQLCWVVLVCFSYVSLGINTASAQSPVMTPKPGVLLHPTSAVSSPILKGIAIDPQDPLKINFVADAGDQAELQEEQADLMSRYFLTFLTIPEEDLWVNLSPTEPNRIVNSEFERTAAGRDMLMEDYILKQFAASITYPESELGKKFWKQVHAKIKEKYGEVEIPLDTINKVWVIPDKAVVYEQDTIAFVGDSRLRVVLDKDYVSMKKNILAQLTSTDSPNSSTELYLKVLREIVIPEIEREVNEGKYFEQLRQMYHAAILAIWFKRHLQKHIINSVYTNQKKIEGIQIEEKQIGRQVYQQYMEALKKGAYNLIVEEYDPISNASIPRKYFSGGFSFKDIGQAVEFRPLSSLKQKLGNLSLLGKNLFNFKISLTPKGISRKSFLKYGLLLGLVLTPFVTGPPNFSPLSQTPSPFVNAPVSPIVPRATAVDTTVSNGRLNISTEVAVVPDEMSFTAQTAGIVTGLDPSKTTYRAGDVIFRFSSPEIDQRRGELRRSLDIETRRLNDLQPLVDRQAASNFEVSTIRARINTLNEQLAQLELESDLLTVRAPENISIRSFYISNGMTVNRGMKVFDFLNSDRVRISLEVPTTHTYFGRIANFRINGQQIAAVAGVEWQLNPQMTRAVATFTITPGFQVQAPGRVNVLAEYLPPSESPAELRSVQGQVRTIAVIPALQERVVSAPAVGSVRLLVREGDRVRAGQVVAIQQGSALNEYREVWSNLQETQAQLRQVQPVDGVYQFPRAMIDELRQREAALLTRIERLREQVRQLQITAPESGTITRIASHGASSFRQGDELLRIKSSQAVIGDVTNAANAILIPSNIRIQINDPIVVQTPSGEFIAARVRNINRSPVSSTMNLTGVQSIQIVAEDTTDALWPNLPVSIIIPAEAEKAQILTVLRGIDERQRAVRTDNRRTRLDIPVPEVQLGQTGTRTTVTIPAHGVYAAPGTAVSLTDMSSLVAGNNFLIGDETISVLKQRAAERIPNGVSLNLNGSVVLSGGNVRYGGGLSGTVQGIMAGVQTGNAIGAALPVVFDLAGQLMDVISGKKGKMQDLAIMMTEIARHRMEDAVAQQVNQATGLFVEVSEAQARIAELNSLVTDLQSTREMLVTRQQGGFATATDIETVDRSIRDAQAQITSLQNRMQQSRIRLNYAMNNTLTGTINPSLQWNGSFPGIPDDVQRAYFGRVDAAASANYRIRGAVVATQAMEKTIELQRISLLPSVSLHSLYITDGNEFNPLYDLVSGSALRTGSLQQGANASLQFSIPIISTERQAHQAIAALEREKVRLNEQRIRAEVRRDLTEAITLISDLSRQITQENINYRNAYQAWRLKADRPDVFRADQLVNDRVQISTVSQRLFELKAQYFRAESRLRQLQILGYGDSLVRASVQGAATMEVVQLADITQTRTGPAATITVPSPDDLLREFQAVPSVRVQRDSNLSVGFVQFQQPQNVTGIWPLMQSGPSAVTGGRIGAVADILTRDPNIVTRTRTMDMFLAQFQSSPQFLNTASRIILTSPYPDVVERLFQSVANRDQGDFRFILSITKQAIDSNNTTLARTGFQILNDALIQNPQRINQLSELRYTFQPSADRASISPEQAEQVLLSFLSWAPDDSIAKIRLLRSDFWSLDQLAQDHARLTAANEVSSVPLRDLLYDEILRRAALNNVDEIFGLGPYEKFPTAFFSRRDVYAVYMIEQFRAVNRTFLTTSPQWRDMEHHVPERLFQRAKQAADNIIAQQRRLPNINGLNLLNVAGAGNQSALSLSYFEVQDLDAQRRYIVSSSNFPELARIAQSASPLRSEAVDRLMTTPQGRILVLNAYLNSTDASFLSLVEGRNWMDQLRADIPAITDPVTTDIVRRSMQKMYEQTAQEWPLNIRLRTYSFGELHSADDPRGPQFARGQITTTATEMALGLADRNAQSELRLFAGQPVFSPEESAAIEEIRQRLRTTNDPREAGALLDQLRARNDPKIKSLLGEISGWRDEVAQGIITNDQSFHSIPFLTRLILWIVGVFGVYFGFKVIRGKSSISKASSEDLIVDLRKELSAEGADSNGFNHNEKDKKFFQGLLRRSPSTPKKMGVVTIPEHGLFEESSPILARWQYIARQWNESKEALDPNEVIYGFNNILNGAAYILQSTVYKPELMGQGNSNGLVVNQQYQRTLGYFNLLAIDTLNSLKAYLTQYPIEDERQREFLLRDIGLMSEMMNYVTAYLRVLEYRGIIDKVMSYKFADDHWAERSKIYPFFRWTLLYSYQLRASQVNLSQEIPRLLRRGEALMPGLYGNDQKHSSIVLRSEEILREHIRSAKNLVSSFGTQAGNKHKMRSFLSRLRLLMVPVTMGFFAVLSILGLTSLSGGISIIGIVGMFIGFAVFWVPHINIMQMSWAAIMDHMTQRLGFSLKNQLGDHSDETMTQEDRESRMIELAVQEGKENLRRELNPRNETSVDMVVIVSENPDAMGDIRNYVRDRRGQVFRGDVPVEVSSTKAKGSANVYFEAMRFAREKIADPQFIRNHPQLTGLSWKDLRVMFVFHGNGYSQDDRILDWAVINGYRAAEAMRDSSKNKTPKAGNVRGGHVVVYSKDVYFGPMLKFPDTDISLLGDWVAQNDLKSFGLMVMDFIRDGISVKEILAKLDIDKLLAGSKDKTYRNRMLAFLEQHYELNAQTLRQYPVQTGLMGFSAKSVGILSEVLDGLEQNPELWDRLQYLHMTVDLLNNLIKPIEGLDEYLDSRIGFLDIKEQYRIEDREDARKLFRPFYQMFARARSSTGGLTVNSVLPHAGAAHVYYIKDQNDANKVTALLSQAGLDDIYNDGNGFSDDDGNGPANPTTPAGGSNGGAAIPQADITVEKAPTTDQEMRKDIERIKQDLIEHLRPSDDAGNDRLTAQAIVEVVGNIKKWSARDRKKAVDTAVPLVAEARSAAGWNGYADYFTTQVEEFLKDEEGGVDFSAIVDRIHYKRPPLLMPQSGESSFFKSSQEFSGSFEGFDFKVISLRPMSDPGSYLSSHLIIQSLQ